MSSAVTHTDVVIIGGGVMVPSLEKFIKDNCIPWPNGENTKQIVLMDGARRRAYLFKDYDLNREVAGAVRTVTEAAKLSEMTENIKDLIEVTRIETSKIHNVDFNNLGFVKV